MHTRQQFSFTGILELVKLNLLTTAVYLPHHLIAELPKGRLRVSGTINGSPFSLAIQYRKNGSRYFTVGAALRKAASIQAGDGVDVIFRILNLNEIEFPEVREAVLHHAHEMSRIGRIFSGPARQNFSDYVETIMNMDVRLKRSIVNIRRSKISEHHTQSNRKSKNQE